MNRYTFISSYLSISVARRPSFQTWLSHPISSLLSVSAINSTWPCHHPTSSQHADRCGPSTNARLSHPIRQHSHFRCVIFISQYGNKLKAGLISKMDCYNVSCEDILNWAVSTGSTGYVNKADVTTTSNTEMCSWTDCPLILWHYFKK